MGIRRLETQLVEFWELGIGCLTLENFEFWLGIFICILYDGIAFLLLFPNQYFLFLNLRYHLYHCTLSPTISLIYQISYKMLHHHPNSFFFSTFPTFPNNPFHKLFKLYLIFFHSHFHIFYIVNLTQILLLTTLVIHLN